ncbi:MAG: hypothetical protein ACLVGR_00985 [Anaerovoracaceae bacterium]
MSSNNKQESRLGKGLSALLGDIQTIGPERKPVGYINKEIAGSKPEQDYGDVLRIPVDLIEPNPYQPRMAFDNEALEELAARSGHSVSSSRSRCANSERTLSDHQRRAKFKACKRAE